MKNESLWIDSGLRDEEENKYHWRPQSIMEVSNARHYELMGFTAAKHKRLKWDTGPTKLGGLFNGVE
jgi:hypothetical protein